MFLCVCVVLVMASQSYLVKQEGRLKAKHNWVAELGDNKSERVYVSVRVRSDPTIESSPDFQRHFDGHPTHWASCILKLDFEIELNMLATTCMAEIVKAHM